MKPARELAHVVEHGFDLATDPRQTGMRILLLRGNAGVHGLHVEAERDEPLLRAVMEVALDSPPSLVAGRDDSCARGDQLRTGGRIRDSRRYQLREACDPLLGASRQGLVAVRARDQ